MIICKKRKKKKKNIYLFLNFRQAHNHSHQSASSSNINNRFSNSKSTNDQHVANNSGSPVNPNNLDRAPSGGQHDNNFAELGSVHTDGIFRKVRDLLKIKYIRHMYLVDIIIFMQDRFADYAHIQYSHCST